MRAATSYAVSASTWLSHVNLKVTLDATRGSRYALNAQGRFRDHGFADPLDYYLDGEVRLVRCPWISSRSNRGCKWTSDSLLPGFYRSGCRGSRKGMRSFSAGAASLREGMLGRVSSLAGSGR